MLHNIFLITFHFIIFFVIDSSHFLFFKQTIKNELQCNFLGHCYGHSTRKTSTIILQCRQYFLFDIHDFWQEKKIVFQRCHYLFIFYQKNVFYQKELLKIFTIVYLNDLALKIIELITIFCQT